jgi:hypothetical protein
VPGTHSATERRRALEPKYFSEIAPADYNAIFADEKFAELCVWHIWCDKRPLLHLAKNWTTGRLSCKDYVIREFRNHCGHPKWLDLD